MVREFVRQLIIDALGKTCGPVTPVDFSVAVPERQEFGDYASNAALVYSKILKKKSDQIASALAHALEEHKYIARAQAVSGFVNITLANNALFEMLDEACADTDNWGRSKIGEDKTAVVDYFGLNIAKRPHVGHLRSAVIGDAIKRILLVSGYTAISDSHVGDWGTQFGILLYAYKQAVQKDSTFKKRVDEDPFGMLDQLYTQDNKNLEATKKKSETAYRDAFELRKNEFAKLEQGDQENRKIWEWIRDISMKKLEESVSALNLLPFDEHRGESVYENDMPKIVTDALRKGIAVRTDNNAVVVDLTNEGLDEAVLIKSDGASTYLLRDLATIQYRKKHWKFDKNIYVVDVRQSHHFKQVFRVAELLGFDGMDESVHVEFGFMKLPEGPLSTRAGTIISLESLLKEARERALAVIKEKNPELTNALEVADQVGLGAIKYFDLSHNRRSDVTFRWEDVLSFEGNTGPYIQYTHARLQSILHKLSDFTVKNNVGVQVDDVEHRLLVAVFRLPEVIQEATVDFAPHLIANYLFAVARMANEFYHSHPVIKESDEGKKQLRVAIITMVALTLSKGLSLLGIDAPEEM